MAMSAPLAYVVLNNYHACSTYEYISNAFYVEQASLALAAGRILQVYNT